MQIRCRIAFLVSLLAGLTLASCASAATITVTTTADDITPNDGSVSLREAITAVNAGTNIGDPDIIVQNPGVFARATPSASTSQALNSIAVRRTDCIVSASPS